MKKTATLVGIGKYDDLELGSVNNAIADVIAIEAVLISLGFSTSVSRENKLNQLRDLLDVIPEYAEGSSVHLFYFAGHGVGSKTGEVYLVPSDFQYNYQTRHIDSILRKCIPVSEVTKALAAYQTPSVIVIDACRRPAFWKHERVRTRHSFNTEFNVFAPKEKQLIVFSTGNGRLAYDGDKSHSPFAELFLNEIQRPGRTITAIFRNVQEKLKTASATQHAEILDSTFPNIILRTRYNYKEAIASYCVEPSGAPLLKFIVSCNQAGDEQIVAATRNGRCALMHNRDDQLKLISKSTRIRSSIYSMVAHPARDTVLLGCKDGIIRALSWNNNASVALSSPIVVGQHGKNAINSLSFGVKSDELISVSHDGTLKLWHLGVKHLKAIRAVRLHNSAIWSVAFCPIFAAPLLRIPRCVFGDTTLRCSRRVGGGCWMRGLFKPLPIQRGYVF